MPRISAPTVREHRAARRARLLDAARAILLERGPDALAFGAVADLAGLARPSVYEYFPSRDHLLAALVDAELPAWLAEVRAELERHAAPLDRLGAFVRVQLEMFAGGKHRVGAALGGGAVRPGPELARTVAATHAQVYALVQPALAALGVQDEPAVARLVAACVADAIRQLKGGAPPAAVARTAVAFVRGAVAACATRGAAPARRGNATGGRPSVRRARAR
ncbi:TetR/AcrR family transcriptional regulator [Anaeromyxobacter sp. Red801]|uniref:TetR/AcrR family transcriptional regulator n=1 Tax=Anaeromyxobacter sp. Red801 TaxID=3411632 RepID=UPI003B9E81F7